MSLLKISQPKSHDASVTTFRLAIFIEQIGVEKFEGFRALRGVQEPLRALLRGRFAQGPRTIQIVLKPRQGAKKN